MATFYSGMYSLPQASVNYYAQQQQQQQQQPQQHHGFQSQTRAARRGASNSHARYMLSPAAQYRQSSYQFVSQVAQKEVPDMTSAYRGKFEAARSFDLEDDEVYCPYLLTEDDVCVPPIRSCVPLDPVC